MSLYERAGMAVLRGFDPERAHGLSLTALRWGLAPLAGGPVTGGRLTTYLAGLTLANPVGLAAGYDKNAVALGPLMRAGFGFLEVGAATPRAQPGNAKPRLFRLTADQAVINRFGFNNDGATAIAARLAQRPKGVPVGLNLGANKDSLDKAEDIARVLAICGPHVDFATVNVSSPNTEKLRDLQGPAALRGLLDGVMRARAGLPRPVPVFLKIAPDLTGDEIGNIAEVALGVGLSGIIATNTTLSRDGLTSPDRGEAGGLSGKPLFEKSTRVLAHLSQAMDGRIPLIGVGGISSAAEAYAKIRAGAAAVQVYSAMVYQGISLIPEIARGVERLLEADGFATVAAAVGTDRARWL